MTNATRFYRTDSVGHNRVRRIMRALEFILIEILVVSAALRAEDTIKHNVMEGCKIPLGMEEGKIPDDAITASSSYESKSVGPQNARIRQEKNGGAWCPKAQISSEVREYLEVDLTRDHLITWTETQGRFGNGQGQEYAESFYLEYWRDSRWHPYKSLGGDRILRGNSNTYLVEQQKLDLPFVASRVRFVPYSQHPRTVCMRVEIFGCVWDQGTRRYEAPRGRVFGPEGANAEDLSYDGTVVEETAGGRGEDTGEVLIGGLGQLTDGVIGEDPYRFESASSSTHWVGWTDLNPVLVVFEFYETRRFEESTVYVANAPDKGVEPFSRVRCRFSRDGKNYEAETTAEFVGSTRAGVAILSIDLGSRLGRFVRFEMVPRSKWLLVSEITFRSDVIAANVTENSWNEATVRRNGTEEEEEETPATAVATMRTSSSNSSYEENETYRETNLTPDAFPVDDSRTYIGLVSGALTLLALLLACTIFLVKLRGRNKVALVQKHTALLCGSPAVAAAGLASNATKRNVKNRRLAVSRSLLRSIDKAPPGAGPNCATISGPDAHRDLANDHCSLYEKTYKLFSEENLAYERHPVCNNEYTGVGTFSRKTNERDEATLWERGDGGSTPLGTPFPLKRRGSIVQTSKHEGYYAATDILTIKRREAERQPGGGGASLFTSLRIDECPRLADAPNSFKIQRISRHRLRILDKIGEGSFGFVHLCEAKGIQSPETTTTTTTGLAGSASRNRRVVVVRSLWRGVTDSFKKAFVRDMCALGEIRDPNIARIIALVEEEPFGAVFEYGQLGDLPNFLRGEDRDESERRNHLGFGSLLNILTRIASGMKFLESIDLPHCDLAARNCVVGNNLEIKISDHAVYRAKYDNEYHVNECYAKIPLRWMAWEAVLLGKRNSCRADVWSYATTAWEILNRCEEMPFSDMTSEQVLQNCDRWYHGGVSTTDGKNEPRILEQPASCPRDLYRLMTECWSKRAEDRPTFQQIHSFLVRLDSD